LLLWIISQEPLGVLFVPQIFLAAVVAPGIGAIAIMRAINPFHRLLILDSQGCIDKKGCTRTYIAWRDVAGVSAVAAVRKRRFIFAGSSGFGAFGSLAANAATYDPSVASSTNGRAAGIELALHPGRVQGRATYWLPDKFEVPRTEPAARMASLRRAVLNEKSPSPRSTTIRSMDSVNNLATYVGVTVLVLCPIIFIAAMTAFSLLSKSYPATFAGKHLGVTRQLPAPE
jgi:hypothetical protein